MAANPYGKGAYERRSAPGVDLLPITPNDDNALASVCNALRIYNTADAAKSLSFKTSLAGTTRTISVPPGLSVEPVVVTHVLDTGTDQADLQIHGYVA